MEYQVTHVLILLYTDASYFWKKNSKSAKRNGSAEMLAITKPIIFIVCASLDLLVNPAYDLIMISLMIRMS
jgi:hypothetical protein